MEREKYITHSSNRDHKEKIHFGGEKGFRRKILKPEIIVIGVFIFALLIRLIYINQIQSTPIFFGLATDTEEYDGLALQILNGNFTLKDFIYLNSLYPFFLSLVYFIFGHSQLAVVLIQAVIDSLSCILIYYIASTLFNNKVGIIASLIYACYGIAIFYTGILLAPTVVIFLTLIFIALLLFAAERRNLLLFFISGTLFGLASLARSNLIVFLFFLPLWFFTVFKNKQGTYKAIQGFVSLLVGFFMIISLISIRNYSITKEFTPSVLGGINFYKGNNPNATGIFMSPHGVSSSPIEELKTSIQYAEKETGNTLTPSQASRYWLFKGLTFIKDNPLDAVSLYMKKFALFWRKEEVSVSIDYSLSKTLVSLFRLPFISFGSITPLALLGLILALRRKGALLITLFTFSYMLSVMIFVVSARYRLPIVPFLTIFSSFALYYCAETIRAKEMKKISIIGAALVLLFIGINKNLEYFTHPLSNTHYSNLGKSYLKEDMLDEALTALTKALSINPNSAEARSKLGIVYSKKGLIKEAVDEYKKALKINPDYVPAHNNLGNIYGMTGRLNEAISVYRKVLDLDPRNVEAHYNLGVVYLKLGRVDNAIAEYELVLTLKPGYADLHITLGTIYHKKGELDNALSEYKKALNLNPRHAKTHYNLGSIYSRKGMSDDAISEYKNALTLDPRYEKAYHSLGSVYGRQGMFDDAISEYKKALTINPNSAKTHYHLGVAYDKKGRAEEAVAAYKKALNLNPRYTKAHLKLASAYYLKRNYKMAIVHNDKARALGGSLNPKLVELLKPYR